MITYSTADGATPTVAAAGTYWLREDVAPSGYQKATQLTRITVAESGASDDVVLFNTPGVTVEPEKTYAIGDACATPCLSTTVYDAIKGEQA